MKINKNLRFAALAALAVTLLCQTSITRADDRGKRDDHGQQAKVTFTKWVTAWPLMAWVAGGDVDDGSFAGEVLKYTYGPVTTIEALYHVTGPKHSFTALVHVEQTGLKAVITGVVTDGWLKGHAVQGEYTQGPCGHDGITTDCYTGTLAIARDSKD
jgi:hypothetical protein